VKRYWGWLFLLVWGWGLLAGPVTAQAENPPVSWDEYWTAISEAQTQVAGLKGAPEGAAQTSMEMVARRLEQITAVQLSDGTIVPVDLSFLVTEMRTDPLPVTRLDQELRALVALRPDLSDSSRDFRAFPDPDRLKQILARSEFQVQEPQGPSLLEQLQERFLRWLAQLLQSMPAVGVDIPVEFCGGISFLLVIAVVFYFWWRQRLEWTGETQVSDVADEMETLTAGTAMEQARLHSDTGDYRTAVRYLYLSALLLLEEQGQLRYDRALTNREYLHSLADRPELKRILSEVVEVFDRVWYGYHELDAEAYQHYVKQIELLEHQPQVKA
jgi:hypothetical protein